MIRKINYLDKAKENQSKIYGVLQCEQFIQKQTYVQRLFVHTGLVQLQSIWQGLEFK